MPRLSPIVRHLALAAAVVYGLVLAGVTVVWPQAAMHLVDSVRDFEVARQIANGMALPMTSQPFAGAFQVPPGYFYLLGALVWLGADEIAVARAIAALTLLCIGLLAHTVRRLVGLAAMVWFVALSLPLSMVLELQTIINPPLAVAAVALLAAALLRLGHDTTTPAEPRWIVAWLLTAWLAPQMHLSSLPLVAFASVAMLLRRPALLRAPAFWLPAVLLVAVTVAWLTAQGVIAPEARGTGAPSRSFAHLLQPEHWWAVATTFVTWAQALRDAPSWLPAWQATLTGMLAAGVAVALASTWPRSRWHRLRDTPPVARWLAWVLAPSLLTSIAFAAVWGVWYFEAMWLWAALCAAITLAAPGDATSSTVAATDGDDTGGLLPLATVTCLVSAVAAALLAADIARARQLSSAVWGWFQPMPKTSGDAALLITPDRQTQFDFRRWVAGQLNCDRDRVVGAFEWHWRDVTRRDVYRDCPPAGPPGDPADGEFVRVALVTHQQAAPREAPSAGGDIVFGAGNLRVQWLPPQRVEIGAARRFTVDSPEFIRYAVHATAHLPAGLRLQWTMPPSAGEFAARIALRCLSDPPAAALALTLATPSGEPHAFQMRAQTEKLGIRYLLLEAPFTVSAAAPSSTQAVSVTTQLAAPLACDVAAYVVARSVEPAR